MPASIWQTLGIDCTHDRREIRRAYAGRLKATNPEDDAAAFQALRSAYEQALAYADRSRSASRAESEPPPRTVVAAVDRAAERRERAEMPPDPLALHVADCDRLTALVTAATPADRAAVVQALESVLSSSAFDDVGVQVQTERWLVRLIAFNQPRSDALLDIAVARFGWNARAIDRDDAPVIRHLLQRREDLRFLREIASPRSLHHRAFAALSRSPQPQTILRRLFQPGQASKIRGLLTAIRSDHPTLIGDLNEAVVASWDRHLSRPRLSSWALWALVGTPVSLLLLETARRAAWPDQAPMIRPVLLVAGLLLPCLALAFLIHLYAIAWPRWSWYRRPRASSWLRIGWAPGVLVLLIAAAVAPPVLPVAAAIAVLATLAGLWVLITGQPDHPQGDVSVPGRLALREIPLVIWWALLRPELGAIQYFQMTAALAAGVVASAFGAKPLLDLWFGGLETRDRRLGLLALAVLTAGAGTLLWLAGQQPLLAPLAAAAIAVVVLIHRVPSVALGPRMAKLRYYVMANSGLVILIILISESGGGVALPVGGTWLLIGVAITVCGAAAQRRG